MGEEEEGKVLKEERGGEVMRKGVRIEVWGVRRGGGRVKNVREECREEGVRVE